MKKSLLVTLFIALVIMFVSTNEVAVLVSVADLYSPMGAGRPPTIPILPPVG